jgi:predicted dehydrogenase
MARGHLRGYAAIKQQEPSLFELVAVCDPVRERAESFAQEAAQWQSTAPKVETNFERMIARLKPNAVDFVTPHSLHHVQGIAALSAGADVMIEKPIGITVRATQAIIKAGKLRKRWVATAENIRRGPFQRTARWAIQEQGMIGQPRLFHAEHASYHAPHPESQWHWRCSSLLGGGGMVMDSGAHFCDTIRYLYGDVESVYAIVKQWEERPMVRGKRRAKDQREDTWAAVINFESGLNGVWSWSIAAPGHSFSKMVCYGSEGCLLDSGDIFHGPFEGARFIAKDGTERPITEVRDEFLKAIGPDERERLFPHGFTEGVTLECYDFLAAIRDNRAPEVDGEAGLKAKAISEAIFESGATGKAVRMKDVLANKVDAYQRPIDEALGLV